jgi:tRNA(Ile)-lysidine synthase
MDITVEPGIYVVAVSGGVDSMVLLDVLRRKPEVHLIVAHYDHGMRRDSAQDRRLVQQVAKQHGLTFAYDEGRLGAGASEAVARKARYAFLGRMREVSRARAIIMAHHQDDLLETAIINYIRGTDRRGYSALRSREGVVRPLLHVSKAELVSYARQHDLLWREDDTNSDVRYLRNRIRHTILSKVGPDQKQQLAASLLRLRDLNHAIDHQLVNYLHIQPEQGALDRQWFIMLPHVVAREVMAAWLRAQGIGSYDRRTLERLVAAAKTYRPGKCADVRQGYKLLVGKRTLALVHEDR